ncbi:MAG: phospholipase D-like domain-containing protein [Rhodobacteraceae bacterium]|nr:phospholipase D-like domain-containing protein [Paracoccaceae bacterium]
MESVRTSDIAAQSRARVLLTAAEAYPALERAFLAARREIWASFRIFDPRTRLLTAEARAVGTTWFDLVEHTLRRGVAIHLTIADFDPVAWPDLHRGTWRAARMLWAAAELAGPGAARLSLHPAMHPARAGLLPRLAVWPLAHARLRRHARWLSELDPARRAAALRDMPGLVPLLAERPDGRLWPRRGGPPRLFPATHHQKLAVFDRRLLYIGGLDLDGRRQDTPAHDRPLPEAGHDVQLLIEGRAAAEAQLHLETFRDVAAGRRPVPASRRLLRTLSRHRRLDLPFFGPLTVADEIAGAHHALAARAERLIYIETQSFRDRLLTRALERAARRAPGLGLILILPAAPEAVAVHGGRGTDQRLGAYLQARCLKRLARAFGPRLFVGSPAQPGPAEPRRDGRAARARRNGAPLVHVRARVAVFDDRTALVTSANLDLRSLRWDTEAGVFLDRPREVADFRTRVMAHWLPRGAGAEFLDPGTAVAAWSRLARANARARPEDRQGPLLPHDLAAAEAFGRAPPGTPEARV